MFDLADDILLDFADDASFNLANNNLAFVLFHLLLVMKIAPFYLLIIITGDDNNCALLSATGDVDCTLPSASNNSYALSSAASDDNYVLLFIHGNFLFVIDNINTFL